MKGLFLVPFALFLSPLPLPLFPYFAVPVPLFPFALGFRRNAQF